MYSHKNITKIYNKKKNIENYRLECFNGKYTTFLFLMYIFSYIFDINI